MNKLQELAGDVRILGNLDVVGTINDADIVAIRTAAETSESAKEVLLADVSGILSDLEDLESDGKLTPAEKLIVEREWTNIENEYTGVLATAVAGGVATDDTTYLAYVAAYDALDGYLNDEPGGLLLSLTTTSDITGATMRSTFASYYQTREDLITAATSTMVSATTTAQEAADQALSDAATAISDAATAQGTADGKVTTFYAAAQPEAEAEGDLWIDTDDDRLYRWNGATWDEIQDADIAQAISDAGTAQTTADGKIVTFYAAAEPTAAAVGDLWVDTDDGNRLHRWSGAEWVDVHDAAIDTALSDAATAISDAATAQGTADGKVTTFYAAAQPEAEAEGDLWIDTDDDRLYRWNGATWDEIQDADIAQAISDAGTAQTTADGKIVTFYQDGEPTADGEGDLWVDTDDNDKVYRWDGADWVALDTFPPDGSVATDTVQDGAVTFVKLAAANFFFTKAVGSENRSSPSSGDVRAYLGKDPAGSQGTTDPVELAIKEYNGENWEPRVRTGMRSGGHVADMLLSGFFQAGESVLSSPGLIWREVTNPFSSGQVSRVAFGNDVLVAVTSDSEIARSTNGGETWSTVTSPFGAYAIQDVEFGNDVFVAVGWGESVARSTDDGATWGSLISMPTSSTCLFICVAYGDGVWMCGGGALGGDAEIARSTDDGASWSLITNPFTTGAGNRCFGLATDGAGTWIAVSEGGQIARSTNDGASFSTVTDPFSTTMIRCAAYGDGVFVVAGDSGKLARSVDGGATWGSLIDAGFSSSLIIDLAYGEGVWIATGEDGTISRSADGGQSWGASVYSSATVQHPFGADGYFSGVVYDETYRRFVAVGDDSDGSGDPIIAIGEWLEAGSGIVQRGTTANGHYIRFSCGIQICWSFDLVLSGLNAAAAYDDWTLPAAMKTTNYMYGCFGANGSHGSRIVPWPASSVTTTTCRFRTSADVSTLALMVFAIGPWK